MLAKINIQERFQIFLKAFSYPNYRLYFGGQAVSLIGTWMQRLAMSWLVYRITNSAVLLGVVSFCSMIPSLFLAPIVGVIADRINRHRLIVICQMLSMLQALALTVLVLTDKITVVQIIILSIFLGIVNAFDMPARQSFLHEMIEKKEDLGNAIGMNSLLFNMARLVGPSLAGIVVALFGEAICFLLNGVSYIAVIAALLMMKLKPREEKTTHKRVLDEIIEGSRYSFGFLPIRYILGLLAVVSLLSIPYMVLMPIFATDILHGGPDTLGFLMASVGVGAVISAAAFAMRRSVKGIGTNIAISVAILSFGLILFALSKEMWLSMLFLVVSGFGQMTFFASSNTSLQTISEEDKRGRVMAFYSASIMGITPFGSLLAGSAAELIGAPNTILIGGILSLVGAIYFYTSLPRLRKIVRPIFIKMGVEYDS